MFNSALSGEHRVNRANMPKTLSLIAAAGLLASAAAAQPADLDFGIDFVTVGAPGNADYVDPFGGIRGRVDHEFRIARTELTVRQWIDFLTVSANFFPEGQQVAFGTSPGSSAFTGTSVVGSFDLQTETWSFQPDPQYSLDTSAEMNLYQAARLVNWLHNDQQLTHEAFSHGVYDTSTFGVRVDGELQDDFSRPKDARYFLPTVDELVKAHYYDPNRFGDGQGGYWLYPNSSDDPLVVGLPEDGGETNASLGNGPNEFRTLTAGMYPEVQSPWGLLDGSGGWGERGVDGAFGSDLDLARLEDVARRDFIDNTNPLDRRSATGGFGLRIAAIPSPGLSLFVAGCVFASLQRSRVDAKQRLCKGVCRGGCGSELHSRHLWTVRYQ